MTLKNLLLGHYFVSWMGSRQENITKIFGTIFGIEFL